MESRLWIIPLLAVLSACGGGEAANDSAKARPATPVTVVPVKVGSVQVTEYAVGTVESANAPSIAAEVIGRVLRVHAEEGDEVAAGQLLAELDPTDLRIALQTAQAEVKRLEALLANQRSTVKRYRRLYAEKTISYDTLEAAESQQTALQEELASAKTRVAAAEYQLSKARVLAPLAGRIEKRFISVGDFFDIGMPLFRISDNNRLRIQIPFPETAAARLRAGLTVELSTPTAPGKPVQATIQAIRPMVGSLNRAIAAVVELDNPGGWRPGASVNARVILEERSAALLVPRLSVVRRPAGLVAYVVADGVARQAVVQTGVIQGEWIEVRKGLAAGDRVVVDGAGYLTDGAAVSVQEKQS